MLIKVLVENNAISNEFKSKHGLSFYIQTEKHKLLFDLGSNCIFLENAKKLGINIKEIDTVILSHGHFDHGGALNLFLKENDKAKIYIRKNAFERHSTKVLGLMIPYGLDIKLKDNPRIILTDEYVKIDDELTLFADICFDEYKTESNKELFMKKNGKYMNDDFTHEQNLIISKKDTNILLCGCAHRGIVNIMDTCIQHIHKNPDVCIGGFHLYNPVNKKTEKIELIDAIASRLCLYDTKFYTCHCTGIPVYNLLKKKMPDTLKYIKAGETLII
ncbi:MAG: MBL fold metallo-hydrolase [Holdemanella sp.]|nr:MBL fold metallo-hydrolase [Holdemanella sp.]